MISNLAKKLNINFNNIDLLQTALTHRSYLNEHKKIKEHNERLEFLGDAVLELIVSTYLYNTYSKRPEGELTSFRSAIVKTTSLADASRELGLGEYLRMAKGEEVSGGKDKDYLLANTFEAVLGAIYLDQGYQKCKELVQEILIVKLEDIVENRLDIDSKTSIQEIAQSEFKVTPIYEVIEENGPDHDREFVVVVKLDNKIIGKGKGSSKQKAEESAATDGLKYIEKSLNK